MAVASLFYLVVVQVLVALVVIVVLKKTFNKELIEAAQEKFQSLEATGITVIIVRLARPDPRAQGWFEDMARRRFPSAQLTTEEDATLKGGVVIIAGDKTLDYSVVSRLRNFWS